MPEKIAVIGAGPGGLTSAMILAARGFDVTVFEAKDRVGGRNAELRLGEFRFDTGPTFLMLNFILREMFEEAGKSVDDYLSFTRLDPLYRLVFDDRDFRPSADPAKMRAEIARAFPGQEKGLDRFLTAEKTRFEKLFPCIQRDYSTFASLFSVPLLKAAPYLDVGRSVFGVLGKYFDEDKLKLAFTFQAKYLGMSPWDCPGFFTMLSYIEHAYGIYHVRGGLNAISTAMAKAAAENGARIRLASPVKRVITEGGAARGVELAGGEVFRCDEVVINADFGHAATTLFERGVLSKYSPEKLQAREFSCSTFMLYLGVDKVYPDLPHHTIAFASDYRRNVEDIFHRKALSGDVSIYVQNASPTDPTLAPPGKSAIYILVPVPNLDGGAD
jgi:phytoene desaturase